MKLVCTVHTFEAFFNTVYKVQLSKMIHMCRIVFIGNKKMKKNWTAYENWTSFGEDPIEFNPIVPWHMKLHNVPKLIFYCEGGPSLS